MIKQKIQTLGLALAAGLMFSSSHAAEMTNMQKGEALYKKTCAACHDTGANKSPKVEDLNRLSKSHILMTLEIGRMQPQSAGLSKDQKSWIAEYVSGGGVEDNTWLEAARCEGFPQDIVENTKVYSANWGIGGLNNRLQSKELAGINKDNVGKLKLKWAFGFQKVNDMRSQPVYTEDALFVGSKSGHVLALDPKTACVKWQQQTASGVRSSLVLGNVKDSQGKDQRALFFADELANVYAMRAKDGKLLWKKNVGIFPTSIVTGSPAFNGDQLVVPLSSYEVAAAGIPGYPCCRSHGAVLSLNANTGEEQWVWHATEHAKPTKKLSNGAQMWGPSGAVVWTTPTIDKQRGVMYFGTGENMSGPATDTSDSVVALDLKTGKLKWKFQALAGDIWNSACLSGGEACPKDAGPDFDFGASIILSKMPDGKPVLLAGQKSGEVFALSPEDGKLFWRKRLSMGTTNGGIHWGMVVANEKIFVPLADPEREIPGYTPKPGLYALNLKDGSLNWSMPVNRDCDFDMQFAPLIGLAQVRSGKKRKLEDRYACSWYYGLSAAPTAVPGLVFAAGLDGKLRAYDMDDGKILWKTDTAVPFKTVNGLKGHGGAIDVDGPVVGGGMLYINSGYSMFGQLPGNVLLAFEVAE